MIRRGLLTLVVVQGLACAPEAPTTGPRIEVSRVQTLVDRDGRGFTRAPLAVQPLSGGRFAISEMNELPIVVDSTGALVKRWVEGRGPGEIGGMSEFAVSPGDSLYVASNGQISVFDSTLRFIRSFVAPEMSSMKLLWTSAGLVGAEYRDIGPTVGDVVHVFGSDGRIIRSFLRDSIPKRGAIRPYYVGTVGSDNTLWVSRSRAHRIERLTLDGTRHLLIDTIPAWFAAPTETSRMRGRVESIGEHDGVLWVLSSVSRPDARKRAEEALKAVTGQAPKYGSESDMRLVPFEELATARLEAYDAATGQLIADLAIDHYPVAILDGGRYMLYTTGPSGNAQLEIWQMSARRQ
jgi:hypothetical protein